MSGKFIVFEGLDGGGKTSLMKEIMRQHPGEFTYYKGIGSDTFIGRFARKHPSTLTFLVELLWLTYAYIIPALKEGEIVLQDRYLPTLESYVPNSRYMLNRALVASARSLLLKPDYLVYLTVSTDGRVKRLKEQGDNPYHRHLLKHQDYIELRNAAYDKIFESYFDKKMQVETTNTPVRDIAIKIYSAIKE